MRLGRSEEFSLGLQLSDGIALGSWLGFADGCADFDGLSDGFSLGLWLCSSDGFAEYTGLLEGFSPRLWLEVVSKFSLGL